MNSRFIRTFGRRRYVVSALAILASANVTVLPVHAGEAKQSIGGIRPTSTGALFTFPGKPVFTVSDHGNLIRFEAPTGYEHIATGTLSEGYVLCYGSNVAYDVGEFEFGFGTASASCAGAKCTITRSTADGALRLTQVITKPTDNGRSLNVDMTILNTSGSGLTSIVLRRQADLDVDTGGTLGSGSFDNWFGASERDSAFAWNATNDHPREDHAIVLRFHGILPTDTKRFAKVTGSILDTTCNPTNIAADGPVQGDYGATVQYNVGALAAGRTAKMTVQYERN